MTTIISNYKPVDGIQIATSRAAYISPLKADEEAVRYYKSHSYTSYGRIMWLIGRNVAT